MNGSDEDLIDSSSDRLPHKPTSDAVTSSPPERAGVIADPAGTDQSGKRFGQDRQAVAGEAGTNRDRPHETPQDETGQIQDDPAHSADAPALPANASGTDKVTVDAQDEEIDDESMYDRRPEGDKNRPPSAR